MLKLWNENFLGTFHELISILYVYTHVHPTLYQNFINGNKSADRRKFLKLYSWCSVYLFLTAAALSLCLLFLNQFPTCVGVRFVAPANSLFLLGFGYGSCTMTTITQNISNNLFFYVLGFMPIYFMLAGILMYIFRTVELEIVEWFLMKNHRDLKL